MRAHVQAQDPRLVDARGGLAALVLVQGGFVAAKQEQVVELVDNHVVDRLGTWLGGRAGQVEARCVHVPVDQHVLLQKRINEQ